MFPDETTFRNSAVFYLKILTNELKLKNSKLNMFLVSNNFLLDLKSLAGCQINQIDVNFQLQKSLEI